MKYVLAQYRWDGTLVGDADGRASIHADEVQIMAQLPPLKSDGTAAPRDCMRHCLDRRHNSRMLAWVSVAQYQAKQGVAVDDNHYLVPQAGYFIVYADNMEAPKHLFRDNLDAEVYVADLRANYDAYHAWLDGRTTYDPKTETLPAGIYCPDANDVSKLEVWSWWQPDFYMDARPYTAYVFKHKLHESGWGFIGTWTGDVLGRIDWLSTEVRSGFHGSRFRTVNMTDWNGHQWYGRWFERSQDCVNLRQKKGK